MTNFDVQSSPLRDGEVDLVPAPLLIEAAAGSGKTWTLAHLAVRFMVQDQVEPGQVLLVTFTRDAARELRGRVREHLDDVISFLAGTSPDREEWREAWGTRFAEPGARERDLRRARHCRANLDGLHARTIHSFAAVSSASPDQGLGDDGRLRRQALAETRARWSLSRPGDVAVLRAHADPRSLDVVTRALYEAGVRGRAGGVAVDVLPRADQSGDDGPTHAALVQREIALDAVDRLEALLRQSRRTSFADLVIGLAERLERDDAERFVAELRATFRVVMIDEFQDTDPLQWHVFREIFLSPGCRLVLVGDPKQAIYRFRSATVETFLDVRDDCRARGLPVATLSSNYRSTPAMVGAINAIFAGTDFHYALDEVPVQPAIGFETAYSRHADAARDVTNFAGDTSVHLRVTPYRRGVADPTLDEVAAYVQRARAAGIPYREVAILATSNEDCRRVHRFLARRRIPSTTTSDVSIFDCAAARQLRHLLAALSAPEDASLTEALRATWFAGPGAADPSDRGVGRLVTRLAAAFDVTGVAALTRFLRSEEVLSRVAGLRDAERHLTDLAHLSELITRECAHVTFPALVLGWLDAASAALDADENTTTRRLETESDAVRILTIHKAKGLEFDVVLLPDLVRGFREVSRGAGALRRWVEDGRTVVDAGSSIAWGAPDDVRGRERRTEAADAGEQRRLIYVAFTRARVATVAWVRLRSGTPLSGEFARLLLDREAHDDVSVVRNRSLAEVRSMFVSGSWTAKDDPEFRAARTDPLAVMRRHFANYPDVAVLAIGDEIPVLAAPQADVDGERGALAVDTAPTVARQRRRWSYSDVARDLKESPLAPDGFDDVGGADEAEPSHDEDELAETTVRPDVAAVFATLSGKRLGLVVHRVLEMCVGSGDRVEDVLDDALAEQGLGVDLAAGARAQIVGALGRVLERPLTPTLSGHGLAEVVAGDVATEMRFLLALGEVASSARLSSAVEAVRALDRSGPDARGLFADYFAASSAFADRLGEGYLVGSLDLTVRGDDGGYRVVDYKTDQVAGAHRPYAPERLAEHMTAQHYPLQALFYAVALHRFLRTRLAGYDPGRHLAGVDYYFVRVVGDASAEPGDGILSWALTPGAVVAASDALAHGRD